MPNSSSKTMWTIKWTYSSGPFPFSGLGSVPGSVPGPGSDPSMELALLRSRSCQLIFELKVLNILGYKSQSPVRKTPIIGALSSKRLYKTRFITGSVNTKLCILWSVYTLQSTPLASLNTKVYITGQFIHYSLHYWAV